MLEAKVGDATITIADACAIKASVEALLRNETFGDPVPMPDDPHLDGFGTWRFGAWALQRDPHEHSEDLLLYYMIANTAVVRVRQEVRIVRQEDGTWKAVSTGRVHYHMRRH